MRKNKHHYCTTSETTGTHKKQAWRLFGTDITVAQIPSVPGICPLFALVVAVALLLSPVGTGVYGSAQPGPESSLDGVLRPAPDAMDDLLKALKDVKKELEDAKEEAGQGAAPGDLQLEFYLVNAGLLIDQVFDPSQLPNLAPGDAGSVDPTVSPVDLSDYADVCLDLADDALSEAENSNDCDHEYIGTKLKTIRSLLPGYRLSAGL